MMNDECGMMTGEATERPPEMRDAATEGEGKARRAAAGTPPEVRHVGGWGGMQSDECGMMKAGVGIAGGPCDPGEWWWWWR